MSALIEPEKLKEILGKPGVHMLDASYNLPASPGAIPGALSFDIDDIADPDAPLPHTIPSAQVFAAKVGALGISQDDTVIVYDRAGLHMAAARAWWMFRLFGHDKVKILNGGLLAWQRAGFPVEQKSTKPVQPVLYKTHEKPELLKTKEQMLANVMTHDFSVLDARDATRFQTTAGHIPGSVNTPYIQLMHPDGRLKNGHELKEAFQTLHAPSSGKIACTCGSGVTACVVALALHELGCENAAVYDGSWTEWGSDPALPKKMGASHDK